MIENKIGNRYAAAIYKIAKERDKVKETYDSLNNIMVLFKENPDFKSFITHPLIKIEEKIKVVDDFLLKSEITTSSEETEIINYILEKKRIGYIKNIVAEYLKIYYENNRILKVVGIFPKELSETQRIKLEEKVKKKTGREIDLTIQIDLAIIGGGILKIDDQVIDGSVRKDLDTMKKYGETSEQEVQI